MFWNTSWILAYAWLLKQDLKMHELVLFSITLISFFSRLFGSFFLVFSSRRSSITLDIQIDLKMKLAWKLLHKHFRTLWSIQDGGFCISSQWFLAFNYFRKTLHLCQDFKFASVACKNLWNKLHLRCLTVLNSSL